MADTEGKTRELVEGLSLSAVVMVIGRQWSNDGGVGTEKRGGAVQKRCERAVTAPPSVLNEVFFLLLRVCVIPLGVYDSRVSIRCVVCSFGLVCQICSFMPGQISPQDND